jgi:plasmid stabilization system protein ParE
MAREVRWTPGARRDLSRVVAWLNVHEPGAAETVAREIHSQTNRLLVLPYLGAVFARSELGDIRETFAANYRIFYRVSDDGEVVEIDHIRHASRSDPRF